MDRTCSYDICTGCGVCIEVCPKDCIAFRKGVKGHLFPKIDTSICIDCKRCVRVCPALKLFDSSRPSVAYAAMARSEDDYLTTTSGGAAQIISKEVLAKGGVVYGCAALPGVEVRHIRVDNLSDLDLLKGSKYVQSNLSDIFPLIKKDIEAGVRVLFIGVPCQVASVISLFGKKPENLLLVDLICHGVPSLASLQDYLCQYVGDLSMIKHLRFRSSAGFQMVASKSSSGSDRKDILYESVPLTKSPYGDEYYAPFFYGFSYRPSCYRCQFAKPSRVSDITIGDFWGLNNKALPMDFPNHQKGISVVLPSSSKGCEMVSQIKPRLYIAERPVEEAIMGNKQLRHPTRKNLKIRIYETLSPYIGMKTSFRLTNLDMTLRLILRPYLRKLKELVR